MVPASTDVAAVAGGGDRHRIPSPRSSGSPPRGRPPVGRASRRRERRRSMRAPAARRAVPGPVMEWVGGPRRVGAVTGFVGVGRPAPGVGRPWDATSGLSVDDGAPPAASGCLLGLRAGPDRSSRRRRWSVCEVAARGELSCRQTTASRGDPHTEGFAGPREWIVGVAGSTPVYRRSPLLWGGRGVGSFRAGRRQPFAGLERAWGLILSRSCCTMYIPSTRAVSDRRHSTARGITNSRCRTAPIGRAGRAPRPGWVVVGEGPVQGWGVAFFAIWGCDRGDGRAGGLCRFSFVVGRIMSVYSWGSLGTREPLVTNAGELLQGLFLRVRRLSSTRRGKYLARVQLQRGAGCFLWPEIGMRLSGQIVAGG